MKPSKLTINFPMTVLDQLIEKDQLKNIENEKVYNFLAKEESDSSRFYSEMFSKAHEKELPELYEEQKAFYREKDQAYEVMSKIVADLKSRLDSDAVVVELGGGMSQKRSGNAYKKFKNYFPLDISDTSIRNYSEQFDKIGFIADATKLPFKSESVDCVLTHTFLEHPIEPGLVLEEIVRVLKPGGIVLHNDAWFCRWWQRYGIVGLKRFDNMTMNEKMVSIGAKITELKPLRMPPIVFRRLVQETLNKPTGPIKLRYQKLKPNYDLHLGCDEDAASRIDPLDVIRFYESRGFSLMNELSLKERVLYRNKHIMLQKNA